MKQLLEASNIAISKTIPFKISVTPPWNLPEIEFCKYFPSFKKDITDTEARSVFMEHIAVHDGSLFVFTDGSKSSAGVGFGVVFNDFTRSGALPVFSSIFTAECHGILCALKEILSVDGENFTIFSDSKSVLQALGSFNPLHPLILNILEWIILIGRRGQNVRFCWVPAHVGIQGNEKADIIAKEAAFLSTPTKCALPYGDFVPNIRSAVESVWHFNWELEGSNKMREFAHTLHPWTYYPMSRRKETALCRLRIGHTRLTHGYLMEQNFQPYCEDCLVPLSVKHILVECPSLIEIRMQCFYEIKKDDGNFYLEDILGKNFNEISLFKFLEEANILHKL